MDEVRRLLAGLADRAVEETPAIDADADVARGRRALRRVRVRRLATGVAVVAAVTAGVVTLDVRHRFGGDDLADAPPGVDTGAGPAATVALTANQASWGDITCGLAPTGWDPRQSGPGQVALVPPGATGGGMSAGAVRLRTAAEADRLSQVDARRRPGRIVHLGRAAGGERVGQTKVGETWLVVRLPAGVAAVGWDDATLLRLIDSCAVRAGATPAG